MIALVNPAWAKDAELLAPVLLVVGVLTCLMPAKKECILVLLFDVAEVLLALEPLAWLRSLGEPFKTMRACVGSILVAMESI